MSPVIRCQSADVSHRLARPPLRMLRQVQPGAERETGARQHNRLEPAGPVGEHAPDFADHAVVHRVAFCRAVQHQRGHAPGLRQYDRLEIHGAR